MKLTAVYIVVFLAGVQSVAAVCCVSGPAGSCAAVMAAKRAGIPFTHDSASEPLVCCCEGPAQDCSKCVGGYIIGRIRRAEPFQLLLVGLIRCAVYPT